MNIYLIKRDNADYDENSAHVIVADYKTQVVAMAMEHKSDENPAVWVNARITLLGDFKGKETKPFIVLTSNIGG